MTVISSAIMYSGMTLAVHHLGIAVQGLSVRISYSTLTDPIDISIRIVDNSTQAIELIEIYVQ